MSSSLSALDSRKVESKMEALAEELRAMAYALGPTAKMPTFVELRQSRGLSQATIGAAFDKLADENIVVRKRGSGIYVSPDLGQTTLGLLCKPAIVQRASHSPFWEALFGDIQKRAAQGREIVQMNFARDDGDIDDGLRARLLRQRERGELQHLLAISLNRDAMAWLENHEFPVAGVFSAGRATIFLDILGAIEQGLRVLFERGCTQLEVWWATETGACFGETAMRELAQRAEAVETRARAVGLAPQSVRLRDFGAKLSATNPQITESVAEQGRILAQEVFGRAKSRWPDGVVIIDDMTCHGALETLRRLGIEAGRDVQIAAHANQDSPLLRLDREPIFRMEFSPALLVQSAFELLQSVSRNPAHEQILVLPSRLIAPLSAP